MICTLTSVEAVLQAVLCAYKRWNSTSNAPHPLLGSTTFQIDTNTILNNYHAVAHIIKVFKLRLNIGVESGTLGI